MSGRSRLARLETFVNAYIRTLLWSGSYVTETGDSFEDAGFTAADLSPDTVLAIRGDCGLFLALASLADELTDDELGRAGHDFCLTRNEEGAGFWDGDWDERDPKGSLDAVAKLFRPMGLYEGDDGEVCVDGSGLRVGVL